MARTDDAIAQIKDLIVSGEIKAGDRLPKESDLAERLGLSRNSLREAVRALSLIRVLDVRHGEGTFVSSLSPVALLEALKFVLDLHQDASIVQIMETRRIIEPIATSMAAAHMTSDGIAEMRRLLATVDAQSDGEAFLHVDLEFHRLISRNCGNEILASILDGLSAPTTRARVWRGLTQEDAQERTLREHEMICEAIAARKPDLAHAWATTHVLGVEEWLRRAL